MAPVFIVGEFIPYIGVGGCRNPNRLLTLARQWITPPGVDRPSLVLVSLLFILQESPSVKRTGVESTSRWLISDKECLGSVLVRVKITRENQ